MAQMEQRAEVCGCVALTFTAAQILHVTKIIHLLLTLYQRLRHRRYVIHVWSIITVMTIIGTRQRRKSRVNCYLFRVEGGSGVIPFRFSLPVHHTSFTHTLTHKGNLVSN